MADLIPAKAEWIHGAAKRVDSEGSFVELEDGRQVGYQQLIVCPGLRLVWERIEGLEEILREKMT
jgi:sulfide:quinone oxidoreductase